MGQVATPVHHSPIQLVTHPPQGALIAQALSETRLQHQESVSEFNHPKQRHGGAWHKHELAGSAPLGAMVRKVQSRRKSACHKHRGHNIELSQPPDTEVNGVSDQPVAHHSINQELKPPSVPGDFVTQVKKGARTSEP